MAVYVDDATHRRWNKLWCHMWADAPEELHAFARRLGLGPASFQTPPRAKWDHYDLTAGNRIRALRMGAVDGGRYGALEFLARKEGDLAKAERIARMSARRAPAQAMLDL